MIGEFMHFALRGIGGAMAAVIIIGGAFGRSLKCVVEIRDLPTSKQA